MDCLCNTPAPDAGHAAETIDEVDRVWREHWWPIVSKDGDLDLEQIKKELFDYGNLLDNVSLVYDHVTGGKASKPFTLPSVINSLNDDYVNQRVEEALAEERDQHTAPARTAGTETGGTT